MTFPRGSLAVVIRVAALTVFYAVFVAALSRSESNDALGAGLLFFVIVFVAAGLWSVVDGARRGFVTSAVVWAFVAVLSGATLGLGHLLTDDGVTAGEALGSDLPFFAVLVFLPAVVGCALGGLVHRGSRTGSAA